MSYKEYNDEFGRMHFVCEVGRYTIAYAGLANGKV